MARSPPRTAFARRLQACSRTKLMRAFCWTTLIPPFLAPPHRRYIDIYIHIHIKLQQGKGICPAMHWDVDRHWLPMHLHQHYAPFITVDPSITSHSQAMHHCPFIHSSQPIIAHYSPSQPITAHHSQFIVQSPPSPYHRDPFPPSRSAGTSRMGRAGKCNFLAPRTLYIHIPTAFVPTGEYHIRPGAVSQRALDAPASGAQ